ncbi:MAG TPA: GNAT family N-acetyltransferase [Alphaproteobacteria bacterium]|nr:GNAT family N-acetyltransferase [Alphaproteobacteria bacterium]
MIPEELRRHRLTIDLIPDALRLSEEPGWNQVAADWCWMIEHGDSFGFSTSDGQLVASGLTVRFNGTFAWISMILVTEAYRRRGLATRLMQSCIEVLHQQNLVPALDASPEGRQVYLPLGFRDVYRTTRLFAPQPPTINAPSPAKVAIAPMGETSLQSILTYDRAVSGTDRSELLRHLFGRCKGAAAIACREGRICGFVLARDGRRCAQIGPLAADDPETALVLLQRALAAIDGPVCLDVGDHHLQMRAWLDANGFIPVTPFIRMIEGRAEPFDDPRRVYVIAGPELG